MVRQTQRASLETLTNTRQSRHAQQDFPEPPERRSLTFRMAIISLPFLGPRQHRLMLDALLLRDRIVFHSHIEDAIIFGALSVG